MHQVSKGATAGSAEVVDVPCCKGNLVKNIRKLLHKLAYYNFELHLCIYVAIYIYVAIDMH